MRSPATSSCFFSGCTIRSRRSTRSRPVKLKASRTSYGSVLVCVEIKFQAPHAIDAMALLDGLHTGLGRARDLPAMDKALIGKSSSDPRCTFSVAGTAIKLQSSTKKSTLTPTWKETFEVPLPKGPPETKWQLVVDVEDWDRVSAADFMGRITVDLEPLADQSVVNCA